jgi:hypothetical protein
VRSLKEMPSPDLDLRALEATIAKPRLGVTCFGSYYRKAQTWSYVLWKLLSQSPDLELRALEATIAKLRFFSRKRGDW